MTGAQIAKLLNCSWTSKKEKAVPQQWFQRSEVIALIKQVTQPVVQEGVQHEQRTEERDA